MSGALGFKGADQPLEGEVVMFEPPSCSMLVGLIVGTNGERKQMTAFRVLITH